MPHITEIAEEINKLKPDLKEFWNFPESQTTINSKLIELLNTPYSTVNVFKIELLTIMLKTKQEYYLEYGAKFLAYIDVHKVTGYDLTRASYNPAHNFDINKNSSMSDLIVKYVTNPRDYGNKYLKTKLGGPSKSTAVNLKLEPNELSLMLFETWLTKAKSINSVQALNFIKLVERLEKGFANRYVSLILKHCPKPSIALQKYLTESYTHPDYPALHRHRYSYGTVHPFYFGPSTMFDNLDSQYKPFVANLKRVPDATPMEISNLVNALLKMKQNPGIFNQVLYDAIASHLKEPEYTEEVAKCIESLKNAAMSFDAVIKELS